VSAAARVPGNRLRRRPAAARRARLSLPLLAVIGCGAAALGWFLWQAWSARHAELRFSCAFGPVPELELTFFPDQFAFAAPSPSPPLGRLGVAGGSVCVGSDLVPERAFVRYEGRGIGTGFAYVQLGQPVAPIELRAQVSVRGRVGEPIGFWCYGWRCAGFVPVVGAEVVAMGGGEHGVPLGSARTDAEGRFEIAAIDGGLRSVGVRVRAPGFALAQIDVAPGDEGPPPVVEMVRTAVLRGSVVAPPGIDPTGLLVLARGLPGVQATPAPDGSFELDHLPPDATARLLVHGLDPGWTHSPARAQGAPRIEIVPAATVRGRVVARETGEGLGGVLVFCGDDVAVRADAGGRYELLRVLPGEVEIVAQWQNAGRRKRQGTRVGRQQVTLLPGQVVEDCVVAIDGTEVERR